MRADSKTEAEVFAVLERFRKTTSERDLEGVLQLFADDSDVFIMGSEATETALGPVEVKKFFERIFARPVAYHFEWKSRSVSHAQSVAWITIDASVRVLGKDVDRIGPYRITAILEKRGTEWLIVHYHGSEPVAV
jgi:ketosteroid isomerase-like protein